jgi:glutamine cyclotransferase
MTLTSLMGAVFAFPDQAARGPARASTSAAARVAGYSYDLVATWAHDPEAFTQGLAWHAGRLYEGTGQYGQSALRESELRANRLQVLRQRVLPTDITLPADQRRYQASRLAHWGYGPGEIARFQASGQLFGEGLTVFGGRIYQLTWVEGVCLVWDLADWTKPTRVHRYEGEGWGLTHDGRHLIMSDGSATLRFRDPESLAVIRSVQVVDPRTGAPVTGLNEVEFARGKVFANIYGTRRIAMIDPASGRLEGLVLLDGTQERGAAPGLPSLVSRMLWDGLDARWEVLNGIAYDPAADRFFVTGKRWPNLFEITLRKVADALKP